MNEFHMHQVLDTTSHTTSQELIGRSASQSWSQTKLTSQLKLQTHRLVLLQDTLKLLYQLWRRTRIIFASEYRNVAFDLCASDKLKSEK